MELPLETLKRKLEDVNQNARFLEDEIQECLRRLVRCVKARDEEVKLQAHLIEAIAKLSTPGKSESVEGKDEDA